MRNGCFSPISVSQNAPERDPSSLHGYKTGKLKEKLEKSRGKYDNEQKYIHCATANMGSEIISMFLVPVMARLKLSNGVVKTYAVLDTCCQAKFD